MSGPILFYLGSFWIFYHASWFALTGLGPSAHQKFYRGADLFYSPCLKVEEVWRQRQERQEAIEQFIGKWSSGFGDGELEIKENREFILKYGEQTIQGTGTYVSREGNLFFIAQPTCLLEKDSDGKIILVEAFGESPTHQSECRMELHVFRADSEDYVLATHVLITDQNDEYLGMKALYRKP